MELNEFQYKVLFNQLSNEGVISLYPSESKRHDRDFCFVSFFEYRGFVFNCYHSSIVQSRKQMDIKSIAERALESIIETKKEVDKILDNTIYVDNLASFINNQVSSFKLTKCRYNWLPKHGLINKIDFNVIAEKIHFHIHRGYNTLKTYEHIIDFFGYEPEHFLKYSSVKYE